MVFQDVKLIHGDLTPWYYSYTVNLNGRTVPEKPEFALRLNSTVSCTLSDLAKVIRFTILIFMIF